MRRGRLIAVEGIDGCGKSTQTALLAEALRDDGLEVVATREPGGTVLGERLRALLLEPGPPLAPEAEALLFAAARAQLVTEVIAPALAAGRWVVADRFLHSSLAYQGVARGLGVDAVRQVNALAVARAEPDLVCVLDLPTAAAMARDTGSPDRIESEGAALQRAVADAYRALAAADPARIVLVAAGGAREEVSARLLAVVRERLSAASSAGGGHA